MAIVFLNKRKKYKYLLGIFFVLMLIIIFLVYKEFFPEKETLIFSEDLIIGEDLIIRKERTNIDFETLEKIKEMRPFEKIRPLLEEEKTGERNPFLIYNIETGEI